ncbi:MAG TPA: hypothetical protein VM433_03485 [Mycobacteriales bacterium]|nr:hypothetical protein [Mycobacteriales bacterium]
MLPPALRRLWRDRETLQLGRPPGPSAVLAGIDPSARAALALLDGTRDTTQVVSEARTAGCPPDRATALLELLDRAGLLSDAAHGTGADSLPRSERERLGGDVAGLTLVHGPGAASVLARRSAARVRVLGAGRVGAAVAGLLAASGVGAVDVDDAGIARAADVGVGGPALDDVGRSRGEAARARLAALAPSTDLAPGAADLVVVAPVEDDLEDDVRALVGSGAPHLALQVRDGVGLVGPLVLPGRSPCLHCLELTRTDLDPDWPVLSAQLGQRTRAAAAGGAVLAAAVAAQGAAQALALLDGWPEPAARGGTLELVPPDWRWRRRSWSLHADCGCVPQAG